MNEVITIQIAKDGNPVPLWNGFQLHSLYEPQNEGVRISEKFLCQILDFDKPLLVFGLGFGYHILPLLGKFKEIYIVESCHELINKAQKAKNLKPVFDKCQIVETLDKVPKFIDFHLLVLRSELRFQEPYFNQVKQILTKPSDAEQITAFGNSSKEVSAEHLPEELKSFSQIKVLVNSPIYGGSYTTAQYVVSAFESLGVSARLSDHSVAEPLFMKYIGSEISQASSVHKQRQNIQTMKNENGSYSSLIESLTSLLSDTLWQDILSFKPQIVFFLAQSPFTDKLLYNIKKAGIISMYWFVEDFRRFSYWKNICNDFDYFFMIQKGQFETELKKVCTKAWGWVPVAAEPSTHKPVNMTKEENSFFGADISFMGAAYPNRVSFFKHFNRNNLKLWGTGWTDSELSKYNIPLKNQRISIEQSNMIYQSTKININLHSANPKENIKSSSFVSPQKEIMFDDNGDFVNPRTFEIAACGGFQLVDDRAAVRELFEVDKEIVLFSTVEEAIDKANFYLLKEDIRKKIASAGREKTLKKHTYQARLASVLKTALKQSKELSDIIFDKAKNVDDFLRKVNDVELERFLRSIDPAMQYSYQAILNNTKGLKGIMKKYEAMILLLETFRTGE